MSKFTISCLSLFMVCLGFSQEKTLDTIAKTNEIEALAATNALSYKQPYGLRVGIDLSRPTIAFFEPEYSGLELVADYRLSQKIYVAAELGNEKKDRQEDLYNFTTSGGYLKLGVDYNTYGNWYGEQNMITIGGRLAYANFSQTLNNYQIFDSNRYWHPDSFAPGSTESKEFKGLSATWLEVVLGVKTKLFNYFYLGGSVRLGAYITNKDPDNFKNLFIPGFNKVTDGARFGIGYNFTLSYLIPLYQKSNATTGKKNKTTQPTKE